MKRLSSILLLIISSSVLASATVDPNLDKYISYYKDRYKKQDLFTKIVDDSSNGFPQLYGVRNLRPVLHGILYRGGAKNTGHKTNPRPNENPLQNDALENLCKEGFYLANYLYGTNYSTAPKETNCLDIGGTNRVLKYNNITYGSESNHKKLLQLIYNNIINYQGPIYLHCWNGWHASGFLSAITLKQFCGMSDNEAVLYWNLGTDTGSNYSYASSNHNEKREGIRKFKPFPEFQIPEDLKAKICPQY